MILDPIASVAIIGCGLMGSGIAQVCIAAGYKVHLYGRHDEKLKLAKRKIRSGLIRVSERKEKTANLEINRIEQEVDSIITVLLTLDTDLHEAVKDADLVVETVVEDLELKKELFQHISMSASDRTILTTNTSSIRLSSLQPSISSPTRFAGLHFFNPVPAMKLVEIISPEGTSETTIQRLVSFVQSLNKNPVHCKDTPGFIVNRLLVPYLVESCRMVERGEATMQSIDSAMKFGAGYPMGPIELCDCVGLDTLNSVLAEWRHSMPEDPRFAPCHLLDKLVSEGKLGKKTKQGFYSY